MHMEAQRATATVDVDTTGVEEPSSNITGRVETPGGTSMPSVASTDGYCKTSGLSRHVEPYFQHFTHFKHRFPRGTLLS